MCVEMTLDPLISPCSVSDNTTGTLVHPENQPHPYHSSALRLVPKTISVPEAKLLSSWTSATRHCRAFAVLLLLTPT